MKPFVINAVRELAAQGVDAPTIRKELGRKFKQAAVDCAILRVRRQGDLPPKFKAEPGRITILLQSRAARQLEAVAAQAEMRPSQWARIMVQRAMAAEQRGSA